MLYTYTPESAGGMIIWDLSGQFHFEDIIFGDKLIAIRQRVKDNATIIKVFENGRTSKIISSVKLEWHKHETDNYFYPIEVETP